MIPILLLSILPSHTTTLLFLESLLEPFTYEFFTNAILVSILVGGVCGLMGVYIVLRGMSYIGHGMSHAVFGGAVVSYIAGFNFYLGAAVWGFVSAYLINEITRRNKIKADAAIGVVTTAGFAIGVLLISTTRSYTRNFEAPIIWQYPWYNRPRPSCYRAGNMYNRILYILLSEKATFYFI